MLFVNSCNLFIAPRVIIGKMVIIPFGFKSSNFLGRIEVAHILGGVHFSNIFIWKNEDFFEVFPKGTIMLVI